MVDGSGLPTAPAVEARGRLFFPSALLLYLCVSIPAAGCVYFNALYNANRLFDEGQSQIEEGREGAGRATLETTIEKAQRIVDNNPDSRWADDALRLIARSRLLREEWAEARDAAVRLMGYAVTAEDSAEAAGLLGAATVHLGDPLQADSLLTAALVRLRDRDERAWLLYHRGLARVRLQRHELVDADLGGVVALRPRWVEPRLERVELMVRTGRQADAAAELKAILSLGLSENDEREVLEVVEEIARQSPTTALAALDDVESADLRRETRAGLVKLRGDLKLAERTVIEGREDYALAASLAPESRAAVSARLALIRLELAEVSSLEELARIREDVERLARSPSGGVQEITRLQETFVRVDYWLDVGNLGYLLAAEAVRDIFRAPSLAQRLFLEYADGQPQSFWAPKAILAALDLAPPDSMASPSSEGALPGPEALRQRLVDTYRDSPYVMAVLGGGGESRFTYEELELGLRRQLERLENLANEEVRAQRMRSTR